MENSRMPPQAIDIEEIVLGALLIDSNCLIEVIDILKPIHFYKPSHQYTFQAIINLAKDFEPIDIFTVANKLKAMKKLDDVGGEMFLVNLTERVATSKNIQAHAMIVFEMFVKRNLIEIGHSMQKMAYDNSIDIEEIVEYSQSGVMKLTTDEIKSEPEHCLSIFDKVITAVSEQQNNSGSVGIKSGFPGIRWHDSDLIICAGRSSMGKTWLAAVKFGYEAIISNQPTLIFSLEMSKSQIMQRYISLHSGISSNQIRDGQLNKEEWFKLEKARNGFEKLPLYIDDNGGLTVFQLVAKARKMSVKHGIKLIIIDYLQLLSAIDKKNTNNRDQEIGVITRTLKALAKELDIPIIGLSQINRGVESRINKRPMMSDLRESGNIEQDADMVIMFYRQFYYTNEQEDSGIGEIIVRKYRHGGLGTYNFYHNQNWTKIQNNPINEKWIEDAPAINNNFESNKDFEKSPF